MTYRGASSPRWTSTRCSPGDPKVALVDEMAHTNVPGSPQREALAGHRRAARRRASTSSARSTSSTWSRSTTSSSDHRHHPARDRPRRGRPRRRADRARRHDRRGAAPADGARQHLPPDKVDAALGNYFRVGNLTALRELALLWLADKVDDQLDRYRRDHNIDGTWEARERVVVALTGGPEGDTLIRRAARIAERARGADLLAVHVVRNEGLTGPDPAHLARQRTLVESIGGTYHQVVGDDIPRALLSFAAASTPPSSSWAPAAAAASPRSSPAASASPRSPSPGPSTYTWSPTRRAADPRPRRRSWQRDESLRRLLLGLGTDRGRSCRCSPRADAVP